MASLEVCYATTGEVELAAKTVALSCEIDKDISIATYTQWDAFKEPARLEMLREGMAATGYLLEI